MEEEGKTIVTRLRRRLSVDADDVSSPTAPVTPTKKRGARLTAKPVLENIDENAPVNSPLTTRRRSAVKDIVEDAMTPSKRNTRVRSNTSITLDTTQTFDSPRARRAARRNSLAGSDAEGPLTPARQTRKPRKDSTSSVENTEVTKPMTHISEEIIKEEPEIVKLSNDSLSQDISPNSVRKSQRIAAKKDRNSLNKSDYEFNTSPKDHSKSIPNTPEIIKKLDEKPNMKDSSRRRTKSLTNENSLNSKQNDKNKVNRSYTKMSMNNNIINDGIDFTTPLEEKSAKVIDKENIETILNTSSNKSKDNIQPKHLQSSDKKFIEAVDKEEQSSSCTAENSQVLSTKRSENIEINIIIEDAEQESNCKENHIDDKLQNHVLAVDVDVVDGDDQCVPVVNSKINSPEQQPKQDNESTKLNFFANFTLNKSRDKKSSINDSCEPMDIDETMPENVSFLDNSDENLPDSKTNEINDSLSCSVSKDDIKIPGNSFTQVKKKSRKSKNSSISEVSNVIDTYQKDSLEKTDDSIKKSRKPKNTSVLEDNNDIFINTSDKSMSCEKSKTPSISENHVIGVSPNNSINVTTHNSTTFSENNKHTDSLTPSGANNLSINKSMSQLKDNSKKFKNSTVLGNKSANKSRNQSDNLEQSSNENKTTLILSHLKDESVTDNNKSLKNHLKESTSNLSTSSRSKVSFSKDTPLKNKSVQNIGMQTSTPVISIDNLKSKNDNSRKNVSLQLNNSTNDLSSNDENNSDEDDSEKDSNESSVLDNEAEDAGYDYESGDSQTEFDRQNADENEIVERGETLTSDEDMSNDTEYEKDSFVVSSNEEDNELLSGSGDNLSMSDNELTMSAKSKKKFNERKVKEQKRASREMFEARHGKKGIPESSSGDEESMPILKKYQRKIDSKLLESGDDSVIKTKKSKQRLDSSSFISEEDSVIKPKTTRLRLNSSGMDTLKSNAKESMIKIKNTSNQILHDTVMDENEITIANQSVNDKKDPLISAIKLESITPQKLNISTVNISVRPDVEEIQVRENSTILNNDETADPLQQTSVIQNEDEDSSSENEEIMQNYDSVLNELNNQSYNKKKIIKNHDTSLNLNKRNKLKSDPLIDRLNITQTKKYKTSEALENNTTNKNVDEMSDESYSLDLKLLFPDDSDDNVSKNKDPEKDFIPLKRTEGKTNIRENIDTGDTNKKNRKLTESKDEEQIKNVSLNKTPNSTNKKNNCSVSFNENDLEISNIVTTTSKKKKSKKTSESFMCNDSEQADSAKPEISLLKTPGNNKKKHEKLSVTLNDSAIDKPLNEIGKEKKRVSDSFTVEATIESSKDASTKKRKRKSSVTGEIIDDNMQQIKSLTAGSQKKKMKLTSNQEADVQTEVVEPVGSTERNKKKKHRLPKDAENVPDILKPKSMKRKEREYDESSKQTKVLKENYFDSLHVSRLPNDILERLNEEPKLNNDKIVSTSAFDVVHIVKRKNKPSHYLEESVYLNSHSPEKVQKKLKDKPKVLPFVPTASTSGSGFTTKFKVNIISQDIKFVAQASDIPNFKKDYINSKTKKKSYEMYRKHRNVKLSKF